MYSGKVAGATLSAISPRGTYVVIGPNHTGMGEPFSVSMCDAWATPLGNVKVELGLAEKMVGASRYMKADELAHMAEHSVEVQLPFLQALQGDFSIVPMVVSGADLAVYRDIGRTIAAAVREMGRQTDIAIIASSDMTHYEPSATAKKKDSAAIETILNLDEKRMLETVERLDISMCGYAPVTIMLAAVKELGAKSARLVRYQTSGDVTGDDSSVVGYAGILIK
jgi:AmmeMemoRadiSam system protein B